MTRFLFSLWTAVMVALAYIGVLKIAGDPVPSRPLFISATVLAIVMTAFHLFWSRRRERQ